jgi:hypothetical protein
MEEYFGVAKDTGVSSAEIEAVQSIVMAVSGGRVRAQFREARAAAARNRKDRE